MLRVCSLAALIMTFCVAAAAAQDMRKPRIVSTPADWSEVIAQLKNNTEPSSRPIEQLNQAADKLFANIAASPVPVLLPFNSAQLLRDAAIDPPPPATTYLIDVRPPSFFQAGPGGYDAVFSVYAKDLPSIDVSYSDRIDVHVSGSALLYELDEPTGIVNWPINGGLGADFPGIRRVYLESAARYIFTRYGVPYVVSIECHDGGMRFHKMSCRDADKVAIRILRSLQVAGGTPQPQAGPVMADTIDRPEALSPEFTYHSPGDVVPGSGMRGHSGRADYTVYSKIRFPLAEAPAFANSQSFNHWGDCDQTGRVAIGQLGKTAIYRCRVNSLPLIADESRQLRLSLARQFLRASLFLRRRLSGRPRPSGPGHPAQLLHAAHRGRQPLRALSARRRRGARWHRAARAWRNRTLCRDQHDERARALPLSAHVPEVPRPGRHGERPGGARGRGARQGRQFPAARAGDHLSPAFRHSGADQIRLGLRQPLYVAGRGL